MYCNFLGGGGGVILLSPELTVSCYFAKYVSFPGGGQVLLPVI